MDRESSTDEHAAEDAVAFERAVDRDGVDRSLIRWMLRLTPTERLKYLESSDRMLASAKRLPHGPR